MKTIIFVWEIVYMEDVGYKDDIFISRDDIHSESCICGIRRV